MLYKLPTEHELRILWEKILEEPMKIFENREHKFNSNPLTYRFKWSTKMISSGGCINPDNKIIKLSVRQFIDYGIEEIENILRHEAAHALEYWLFGVAEHKNNFKYLLQGTQGNRYNKELKSETKRANLDMVK